VDPHHTRRWRTLPTAWVPHLHPQNDQRSLLPPAWTKDELAKRSSIERFFDRVFLLFPLQRPPTPAGRPHPPVGPTHQVALTYTAVIVVALIAHC